MYNYKKALYEQIYNKFKGFDSDYSEDFCADRDLSESSARTALYNQKKDPKATAAERNRQAPRGFFVARA